MKMRNPTTKLKHAKGQIFTCGIFGTCTDSVLSPRTPPPLVISNPVAVAPAPPQQQPSTPPTQPQQPQQATPTPPLESLPPQEEPAGQELEHKKQLEEEEKLEQSIPSPDAVTKEKMISQWDFGLKQKKQQLKQQQEIPAERAKERYVGLVDRDLSPFQQQLLNGGSGKPPLPPSREEDLGVDLGNLEAVCKEVASGRISKATLRSLRVHADEDDKKKASVVQSGVPERLISFLAAAAVTTTTTTTAVSNNTREAAIQKEAFALLSLLADDDRTQAMLARSPAVLAMLDRELKRRSADAWVLLCKASTNENIVTATTRSSILAACVELLRDPCAEAKLVRLALKALLGICLSKPNRAPAVEAGAVAALVETLADLHGADGGDFCSRAGIVVNVERALATLELLCTTPEGRLAACSQRGFVTELVGLVLGVSDRATEYAAGVLCAVLCDAQQQHEQQQQQLQEQQQQQQQQQQQEGDSVQELAVRGGAPAQMLLVMQSECSERARRKAAKLLKALHRYGEDHSTIHSDLASTITY